MGVFWINTNTHYKIWRDFLIITTKIRFLAQKIENW